MKSKQHLRSLDEAVRHLDKALASLSTLEEIQRTGTATHPVGISAESMTLLSRSPTQLSQAIASAQTSVHQATAALHTLVAMKFVRERIDWMDLDRAHPRTGNEAAIRQSDSGLPSTATAAYWASRRKSAEDLPGQFKEALAKVVDCRVRAGFINDIVARRQPRLTSDLPGDLVTLETTDGTRLTQLARDCATSVLRAECAFADLVCRTAQGSPHALTFFDELIGEAAAQSSGEADHSYRNAAIKEATLLYRQARSLPPDLREAAWRGLFSFRGRCSRKHWWIADLGWSAATSVSFLGLWLTIRTSSESIPDPYRLAEDAALPKPSMAAYAWLAAWLVTGALSLVSMMSFSIRRLRDAGLSHLWFWMRIIPLSVLVPLVLSRAPVPVYFAALIVLVLLRIVALVLLGFFPSEPVIEWVRRHSATESPTPSDARRQAAKTSIQTDRENRALVERWRASERQTAGRNESSPLG